VSYYYDDDDGPDWDSLAAHGAAGHCEAMAEERAALSREAFDWWLSGQTYAFPGGRPMPVLGPHEPPRCEECGEFVTPDNIGMVNRALGEFWHEGCAGR